MESVNALRIVAAGKAAWPMLLESCAVLGARVTGGVAAGTRGEGAVPPRVAWIDGGHPLPDARSVEAARAAMALAEDAKRAGDGLLVLLSGGGSAMLAAPAAGVTLEEKRQTVDLLLRSGADIAEVNCVRKHLSAIKGGRLAAAASGSLTLAISDVHAPEDDPATIASGPTAPDPTTYADALSVLDRRRCPVHANVRLHLERGAAAQIEETIKPGDPRLTRSAFLVIGNRRTAMAGAVREAKRRGYVVRVVERPTQGEARDAGRILADMAMATKPLAGPMCLVASGETIVKVRGAGKGGRNQEFVIGAASTIARGSERVLIASAGTDGVDGPTDAAGAVASSTTLGRLRALGIDLADVLERNDAYPVLERLGDLIKWGPTLTNVGDVHVVLTMGP